MPPLELGEREGYLGASIGIAYALPGSGDAARLLQDADIALYQAKGVGRNTNAVFNPLNATNLSERWQLENDLRHAIERGELRLHYQPQVAFASDQIVAVEALLRWAHPERGLVAPDQFIPLAEESGLIVTIGRWVLEQACQQIRGWQVQFPDQAGLSVAVNVSARQLARPQFVHEVWRVLDASGLPPENLELELTEQVLIEDLEAAATTLQAPRKLGVRIAIDDFGTDYGS